MGTLGVITGAAAGIGRATAERFAAEGWSLVLVDIDERVNSLAKGLPAIRGQSIVGVVADVTERSSITAIQAAAESVGQPLRFLGLVAGRLQKAGTVETMDIAEWERVMAVNVTANVLMMKQFIPALRAAQKASVVIVSSLWGHSGQALYSAYCASKAAAISLTQSAAAELAPDIRVNCVAPGNVTTAMHLSAIGDEAEKRGLTVEEMKKIDYGKIPLGRLADPAEIASAIYFLASDQGSYVTGATLDVNGGKGFF
jgi:NAD(P)-dependent dehydrogenase (short-subunit alcohol dehydrogenase family)